MRKKLLKSLVIAGIMMMFPISAMAADGDVEINAEKFPDEAFRSYVSENFDTDDEKGVLSQEEIDAVDQIYVLSDSGISSVEGIEYFPKLTKLDCGYTEITSLDVSKNTELQYLDCASNEITSLDVSKNTELQYLDCSSTGITRLDVSKNTELQYLDCGSTGITSLDVSQNIELISLSCVETEITSLDISKNTELTDFDCRYTGITSLNVSQNTELIDFRCSNTEITSLDVSQNIKLQYLHCGSTGITSLDVSQNIELIGLSCLETEITRLDVSKNTLLQYLYCDSTGIISLDVGQNTELKTLSCIETGITSLNVSQNTSLYYLYCKSTEITSLDVSQNTRLLVLLCGSTGITSLDISNNTALVYLDCADTGITSLDTSNNTKLETLIWDEPDSDTTVTEYEAEMTDGVLEWNRDGIAGVSQLTVYSDDVTLVFDEDALASVDNAMVDANTAYDYGFDDFTITATAVDVTTLDEDIQALIGTRPIFYFSIWATDIYGNSLEITEFGDGGVTITIAYELAEGESADNLVIYYISDDGVVDTIAIDSYEDGMLTFTTTHFSTYAVGYEEDAEVTVPEGYFLTRDYYDSVGGEFTSQIFGLTDGGVYTALEGVLYDLDGDTTLYSDIWGHFAIYDADTGEVLYDTYNDNFTAFDQTADGGCGGYFEFVADALEDGDYVLYFAAEDSEGVLTERIIRFTIDAENGTEAIAIDWDGYTFEAEYYDGELADLFVDDTTTDDTDTTTDDTDTTTDDAPETGDTSNIMLYMMLAALAFSGIAVITKRRMA